MKDIIKTWLKSLDGWLTEDEGQLLFNLAKRCVGEGVIVEIGSWKGKSTIWLAHGSLECKKLPVYAIDPHTGSEETVQLRGKTNTFQEFKENIKKANVSHIIKPLVKTSKQAAKEFQSPIGLIFIDGVHEYKHVKQDFQLWYDRVLPGGIMVFHDAVGFGAGPSKLVNEELFFSGKFKNIRFVDSIVYAIKVDSVSPADYLSNAYIFLLKLLMEASHLLFKQVIFPRRIANSWKHLLHKLQ